MGTSHEDHVYIPLKFP